MRYTIKEAWKRGLIVEGARIKTNGAEFPPDYYGTGGIIGEVDHRNRKFFYWQNLRPGTVGSLDPKSKGYLHSWIISEIRDGGDWIEFIEDELEKNIQTEKPVYIVFDSKFKTLGTAKDKRQLTTVLKSIEPPFRIFKVEEVKTKITLVDL